MQDSETVGILMVPTQDFFQYTNDLQTTRICEPFKVCISIINAKVPSNNWFQMTITWEMIHSDALTRAIAA
jgi:hypothetical protein